jgi:hypothetical protein
MPATDNEVREWFFSFGYGQALRACTASGAYGGGEGIPLDNCFVRITGTHQGARAKMADLFGRCWCDQYNELPKVPDNPWIDITGMLLISMHAMSFEESHGVTRVRCRCGYSGEWQARMDRAAFEANEHMATARITGEEAA